MGKADIVISTLLVTPQRAEDQGVCWFVFSHRGAMQDSMLNKDANRSAL